MFMKGTLSGYNTSNSFLHFVLTHMKIDVKCSIMSIKALVIGTFRPIIENCRRFRVCIIGK